MLGPLRCLLAGRAGVSSGQFYQQYLEGIALNKESINWLEKDLSFLVAVRPAPPSLFLRSCVVARLSPLVPQRGGRIRRIGWKMAKERHRFPRERRVPRERAP